jgi:hypothetical protein
MVGEPRAMFHRGRARLEDERIAVFIRKYNSVGNYSYSATFDG